MKEYKGFTIPESIEDLRDTVISSGVSQLPTCLLHHVATGVCINTAIPFEDVVLGLYSISKLDEEARKVIDQYLSCQSAASNA